MTKRCYITTPIYYANGEPHIGTAYTSLIADILARTKRMLGYQVKFATGTDENGQKMKQTAIEHNQEVMEFLDGIAKIHQDTRDAMNISYTDFIRTTHPTHHAFVTNILEDALSKGHVYQGEYEGLYCVGCEGFKKSSDLIEHQGKKVCPDHLKEPDSIKEKNRFFKLKEFQESLEEFYKHHPDFSIPGFRYNEIKSFVDQGLEDFSISREGSDFGIPLPDNFQDPGSVVYIRFDALYNYLTVCQYPQDFTKNGQSVSGEENDMVFRHNEAHPEMSEVIHTLGKDISRFHAIYRPAMLMSSEYKIPNTEIINGFFTVDGQKMSKSLGNKIDPLDLVNEHGRDALVYYLFSDIKIGNDGDFSRERFEVAKENVLKKGWGNLVSRVGKLCKKYEIKKGMITKEGFSKLSIRGYDSGSLNKLLITKELENNNLWKAIELEEIDSIQKYLETADYMTYLRDRFQLVQLGNQYMQDKEPWVKIKDPATEQEAREDLQLLLWLIKNIALLGAPFLVEGFARVQDIIQVQHTDRKLFQTTQNEEDPEGVMKKFKTLLELQEFKVQFGEGYVY